MTITTIKWSNKKANDNEIRVLWNPTDYKAVKNQAKKTYGKKITNYHCHTKSYAQ